MDRVLDKTKKPTEEIKRMSVKEFREQGYLLELNRQFLHPLGLALEIEGYGPDGEERFGKVWDYRDDPEGMTYHESIIIDQDTVDKVTVIRGQQILKAKERKKRFGWVIQPIAKKEVE